MPEPDEPAPPASGRRAGLIRRARALVPRLEPVGRWAAGVVAAALAAVLTAWLLAWGPTPDDRSPSATPAPTGSELPFTVAVRSGARSWASDKPMAELPPRPGYYDDWRPWAAQVDAVDESPQVVYVTVQGRSDAQVTLTDLRVRVVARRPPLQGTLFGVPGGGDTVFRWVSVDLDADPPGLSTHLDEHAPAADHERRPIRFPYRVSRSDAETFEFHGYAERCDCAWVIELSWASEGRTGAHLIDNGGKPFRVTGASNIVRRCWTSPDGEECSNDR